MIKFSRNKPNDTVDSLRQDVYDELNGSDTAIGAIQQVLNSFGGDIQTLIDAIKRTGQIYVGAENTVPAHVILANGATKSRTTFADFYAYALANFSFTATDAAWLAGDCGKFSPGDGSTTFRMPDWCGLFPRVAGTNSVYKMANGTTYFAGGTVLSILKDMMFGHVHSTLYLDINVGGGSSGVLGMNTGNRTPLAYQVSTAPADGGYGTPNAGGETAPVKVALNFGFYYQ
jgi:hypothetical protein